MELVTALNAIPWLTGVLPAYLAVNAWVIAPSLTAPHPTSRVAYRMFYRASTVMAGNYGRARNAEDRPR